MTTCMYVGRDAIPYVSKKCVRSEDSLKVDTITFSNAINVVSVVKVTIGRAFAVNRTIYPYEPTEELLFPGAG